MRNRRRLSNDPTIMEWVIVIGAVLLSLVVILLPWVILAGLGAAIAEGLGYSPWLGAAILTAVGWLIRLIRS